MCVLGINLSSFMANTFMTGLSLHTLEVLLGAIRVERLTGNARLPNAVSSGSPLTKHLLDLHGTQRLGFASETNRTLSEYFH